MYKIVNDWFQPTRVTDKDGRCGHLLTTSVNFRPGTYKVHFDTGTYFSSCGSEDPFYPYADVSVTVYIWRVKLAHCLVMRS